MTSNPAAQNGPPKQETSLLIVLCAVDIEPVPDIATYIPKIQSALRLAGYPVNEVNSMNEILVSPEGVQTQLSQEWGFYDIRRQNGLRLSSSRFIMETTAYTTFAELVPFLEKVLAPLEIIGLMAVQRIGLRYVNAIQPQVGEEFENYLHERLSGLEDDFVGIKNTTFAAVIQGQTDEGTTLSIRVHQPPSNEAREQPILLPPGLISTLKLPQIISSSLRYRLLDLDHQGQMSEEFSTGLVIDALERLHHKVGEAFKNSLQEDIYRRWAKQ